MKPSNMYELIKEYLHGWHVSDAEDGAKTAIWHSDAHQMSKHESPSFVESCASTLYNYTRTCRNCQENQQPSGGIKVLEDFATVQDLEFNADKFDRTTCKTYHWYALAHDIKVWTLWTDLNTCLTTLENNFGLMGTAISEEVITMLKDLNSMIVGDNHQMGGQYGGVVGTSARCNRGTLDEPS